MTQIVRPLFIGLPGAGKTTLSTAVADKLGFTVIGTDPLFRIFRALPAASTDPKAAVMRAFLDAAQTAYPEQYEALKTDAATLDDKGRCALHDSTRFRAYGEDVFRLFETEMLCWLDANHDLDGKIVDLSASAPLYPRNQQIFSREGGYSPILIDTPIEIIAQNVRKDFMRYLEQTRAAGEKKPIRGAYEKAIETALAGQDPESDAGQETILQAARAMTEKEDAKRMAKYRAFTGGVTIRPDGVKTVAAMVDEICEMIRA